MTVPIDLNRPPSIEAFTELLYEAASVCLMDAEALRQLGSDDRVWRIAQEKLCRAANRIKKKRTAGLPSVLRMSFEDEAYS